MKIVIVIIYVVFATVVGLICGYKWGIHDLTKIIDRKIKEFQEAEKQESKDGKGNQRQNQSDKGVEG